MTASFRSERSASETAGWTDVVRDFEDAWRSTSRPSLRLFLERVPPAVRSSLLRELLLRDWQLRAASGETPSADDYVAALPEFADEIRRISVDIPTINAPSESVADPSASTRLGLADGSTPAPGGDHPGSGQPVLFGEYEILEAIGKGGMGVVYKARHRRLGRLAAIKVLRTGKLASGEEVARFAAEAQAAAQLDHPGIVPVYEVGQHEGQHFLALAFIEGESLSRRVQDGPLEPSEAARIVELAARAVQFSHEHGVIHRDLKPANILIAADGQPKVTDFGLAKLLDRDTGLTQTGQILGTPAYMPPEQAGENGDAVGPLADVYSLGATLYCLLTGRPPFQAATVVETLQQVVQQDPVPPRALNAAIPVDLETICLKALQKEPAKRYASAEAFAADLHRFQTGHPIVARQVTATERAVRWCRREPVKAGLAVTAAASLLIGTVATSVFAWQASDRAGIAETALGRETSALLQAKQDADAARRAENAAEAQRKLAAEAADQARAAEDAALKQADYNAQLLYDSDMQYVQQAWERGELPEVRTRLARHIPKEGEKDRRNFEWYYWDRLSTRREPIQFSPQDIAQGHLPRSAILFNHHQTVLTIDRSRPGLISLWTVIRNGVIDEAFLKRHFEAHATPISVMRLSQDERTLATADRGGNVKLWDTADMHLLRVLPTPHNATLTDLVFDLSGDTLATVSGRGSQALVKDSPSLALGVWSVSDGVRLFDLRGTDLAGLGDINTVEFSPSSDRLLLTHDGSAALIDISERRGLRTYHLPFTTWYTSTFRFADKGNLVVGLGAKDQLFVWDALTGIQRAVLCASGTAASTPQSLSVSPDGGMVAVGQDDLLTTIWDVQANRLRATCRGTLLPEDRSKGLAERYGPLYADRDAFWNEAGENAEFSMVHLGRATNILAIDPTHSSLIVDTDAEHAAFWRGKSLSTRNALIQRGDLDDFNVNRVRYDPTGAYVAMAFDDGHVDVLNAKERTRRPYEFRHEAPCFDVVFIPKSFLIATCSAARDIRLWDISSGKEVARLTGHTLPKSHPPLARLGRSPGPEDASGDPQSPLATMPRMWVYSTAKTGRPGRKVKVSHSPDVSGAVFALAAAPSGEQIASIGGDGTLRVWDIRRRLEIWRTSCIWGDSFRCVAFDPQGKYLAAGGDGTVAVWDIDTHERVAELTGHSSAVRDIKFTPDGDRLASTAEDGTVRLWDVMTAQHVLVFDMPKRTITPSVGLQLEFDVTGRVLMAAELLVPELRVTNMNPEKVGLSGELWQWDARNSREASRKAVLFDDGGPNDEPGQRETWPRLNLTEQPLNGAAPQAPATAVTAGGMTLVRISNGKVTMDNSYQAIISRPFYLGETEVTVAQFRKFVEATEYVTDAERFGGDLRIPKGSQRKGKDLNWRTPGFQQADDHPVVQVSWNDARAFCDWLTNTEGVKHRLPTEAEWEWACRAGGDSRWAFGFDEKQLSDYAWYLKNCQDDLRTRPVGKLKPNAWGLYDMYGNVSEWVSDYVGDLPRGTFVDPQGPASHPEGGHLARGGAFDSEALGCSPRSYGWSWWGGETFAVYHFGFRVLREIPLPAVTPKAKNN